MFEAYKESKVYNLRNNLLPDIVDLQIVWHHALKESMLRFEQSAPFRKRLLRTVALKNGLAASGLRWQHLRSGLGHGPVRLLFIFLR